MEPGSLESDSSSRNLPLLKYLEDQVHQELILESVKRNEERETRTCNEQRDDSLPEEKHLYQNMNDFSNCKKVSRRHTNDSEEPWNAAMHDSHMTALSRVIRRGARMKVSTREKIERDSDPNDLETAVVCRTSSEVGDECPEIVADLDTENFWKTAPEQRSRSTFSIPPGGVICDYSRLAHRSSRWTTEGLGHLEALLRTSGFYHGRMTTKEAGQLLGGYPLGTFLLRDSSDRRYLLSLSVQTDRGSTSVRIAFDGSRFSMDSEPEVTHLMPTFDCVLRMVECYRRVCIGRYYSRQRREGRKVFLESSANRNVRILLRQPLHLTPESLSHVCRKLIHSCVEGRALDRLPLSPSLRAFLMEYPYDV